MSIGETAAGTVTAKKIIISMIIYYNIKSKK